MRDSRDIASEQVARYMNDEAGKTAGDFSTGRPSFLLHSRSFGCVALTMKLESILLCLSAASAASAAAIAGAIPEKEIIETLLKNDGFLMLPSGL